MQYFGPDYELDVRPCNMSNANTVEYLGKIRNEIMENLNKTEFAPSVQMTRVPQSPILGGMSEDDDNALNDHDEDVHKDNRFTQRGFDRYLERADELSDSEDGETKAHYGIHNQTDQFRRRNIMNFRLKNEKLPLQPDQPTPREMWFAAQGDPNMQSSAGDSSRQSAPTGSSAVLRAGEIVNAKDDLATANGEK